jgi:S1-C subfamily serine protease
VPEDDAASDEGPLGRPLPPEDRLWRHPSEVSWPAPAPSTGAARAPGSRLWTVALTSGLTGAVLALGAVAVVAGFGGRVTERVVERVPVDDELDTFTKGRQGGVPAIAAEVSPSIVRLDVTTDGGSVTGSGVVLFDDGTIVTNAHVVAGALAVTVVRPDGAGIRAEVLGVDRLTDVAVVVVDEGDAGEIEWVPAVLGSAVDLEVGEPAIAIGSPFGLAGGPSVTVGVVSGLRRRVSAEGVVLHDMIQTDAPIALGSSGGALCDESGVVVGITTALATTDAGPDGLGFAVPIDVAKAVAEDLLGDGTLRRSWLGIEGADVDATPATLTGVVDPGGVRVVGVVAGGPAEAAGIVVDDVIVAVGGDPIASMADLVTVLRTRAPGEVVRVEVRRGSTTRTVDVTLRERP